MKVKEILEAVKPVWKRNERYDEINPKVTVILPTYKRAKNGFFERAVESVIAQTYTDWELIIVDDASTDGTEELIEFYMSLDKRINTIRHTKNLGLPSISEYEGYVKARGKYIAFIFDDNVWTSNHLLLSIKAMIKNNVKVSCGYTRSFYGYGENQFIDLVPALNSLFYANTIGNAVVVIEKAVFETSGLYDPHLSLTRLCDWDLWRRISKIYTIHIIPDILAYEYGVTQSDSLGNSVEMNSWIALETMSYDRDEKLLPKNFEEYDIIGIHDSNTELYRSYIQQFYNSYKKKIWYHPLIINPSSDAIPKKRIVIILNEVNATFYLGLSIFMQFYIIRICLYATLNFNDILWADAIVHVRNIVSANNIVKNFWQYKIPSFYYIDDNFWALAYEKDLEMTDVVRNDVKTWCEQLSHDELKNYKSIIVSTDEIGKVFLEKELHRNIITLPPCVGKVDFLKPSLHKEQINIAFIGGSFRESTFVNCVYPALIKLSEIRPIKLVCTSSLARRIGEYYDKCDEIEIKPVDFILSHDQMISFFKEQNINILIHTGKKIKNNKFKTCNALINAVRIGSILITSNIDPYRGTDAIITSENTEKEWYKKLKTFFESDSAIDAQYDKCIKYVRENYSDEAISETADKIFGDVEPASIPTIMSRTEKAVLNIVGSRGAQPDNIAVREIIRSNYDFIDKLLSFGVLRKKSAYKVTTDVVYFSAIGFLFASDYSDFSGTLKVELYDKRKLLGEASLDLSSLKLREINYFQFSQVISAPKIMTVVLTADYKNSHTVGVYENSMKKNLVYKVFNKFLRIKLPVKDLAYCMLK